MEKRKVYADYSATTPIKKEVLDEMMPYLTEVYGNASSFHTYGKDAKRAVDEARIKVANLIGASEKEIYFTAGGTESDNWAIKGVAFTLGDKGKHIITSKVEHHAVLHTCEFLEKNHGFEVTYLDVDSEGLVSIDDVKKAIREDTILISIMMGNNEIGTIQPIKEIGELARERKILFHTDAVQAAGNIPIDVKDLNVDLMSISSHKVYGPKGIGALYIRRGVKFQSIIHGGAHERGKRAGTENVPAIVGFGKAAEIALNNMEEHVEKLTVLRNKLIDGIIEKIPDTRLNGSLAHRLPNNVNVSFEFIEGEGILLLLDYVGIAASSGSACTSGSLDPSHVLMAIGLPHEIAHGSLRLTIGDFTTEEDVDYIIEQLPPIIEKLRSISPLYSDKMCKAQ